MKIKGSTPMSNSNLLFTEQEWNAAMPEVTRQMTSLLQRYRTPVFIDRGDHGEPNGSGSFIEVAGSKYILTNQHVAHVRGSDLQLGFRFDSQDQLPRIFGNHIEKAWPWDLALLPVKDEIWSSLEHTSSLIQVSQLALAHIPLPGELYVFSGYSGERTTFIFGEMQFGATTSMAREKELNPHDEIDPRFHFGISYSPDLASTVIGQHGLPRPPGLSGSTVWNTSFVQARASGIAWTPELARVVGVIWGWPSGQGAVVATRAEHVRSFLLAAQSESQLCNG